MNRLLSIVLVFISLISCNDIDVVAPQMLVNTPAELNQAIKDAKPGDEIVMANGTWDNVEIKFLAQGTEEKPITLKAETPGEVIIQGTSNLRLGGDYLVVHGLYFTNGYSPTSAVIQFAINNDTLANHSTVTNCVIKDFNKPQRNQTDLWVLLKGRHNQLDHAYLAGKSNRGPTVRVDLEGNQSINNYHKITNNHFGPRPPKGGPSAETIQIGNSFTSMSPSYTLVANNFFERCNGEVEIISSKTNFNEFRNNVFYKSEGSLVTRHGNYCTVDGNYFIGDGVSEQIGGIRIIGTGHWITNNYFYNLKGKIFRSPLAVMNGIPKSPQNRYTQVTDVVVAHNSWINCVSPLQFGVGTNIAEKDVLPASEIRSARPLRTIVANNLIYNTAQDTLPVVAHDLLDGVSFKSNLINNQGGAFNAIEGLTPAGFELQELEENVWMPKSSFEDVSLYNGFDFDTITADIFGSARTEEQNELGAVNGQPGSTPEITDQSKYGPAWYTANPEQEAATTHAVASAEELVQAITAAKEGDIISLTAASYEIGASLKINKTLTIQAADANAKPTITYSGAAMTPVFEMNPKGLLTLKDIKLQGTQTQYAFASLKENMSSLYNLFLTNCEISNFDYVLKAYKYSFAEYLDFKNSRFTNCNNGLELIQETDDKGDYNAENITITNCHFEGVAQNVINYYRGGYDESTVGGNLLVRNSTFTNCGAKDKSGVLLNTYGIINVSLVDNTFQNNRVKLVAQLWGAKNNSHANNTLTNSGKIVVEENLKLKLVY